MLALAAGRLDEAEDAHPGALCARRAREAGDRDPRPPAPAVHALRLPGRPRGDRAGDPRPGRRLAGPPRLPLCARSSPCAARTAVGGEASARGSDARRLLGSAVRSGVAVWHEPARRDVRAPARQRFCGRPASLLVPWAALNAADWPEGIRGSVARYLGISRPRRRLGRGHRHFDNALAMNEQMGARPWLAHTQEDYARMLDARGDPGIAFAPRSSSPRRSRPTANSAWDRTWQGPERRWRSLGASSRRPRLRKRDSRHDAKIARQQARRNRGPVTLIRFAGPRCSRRDPGALPTARPGARRGRQA